MCHSIICTKLDNTKQVLKNNFFIQKHTVSKVSNLKLLKNRTERKTEQYFTRGMLTLQSLLKP